MSYELRANGRTIALYENSDAAVERARMLTRSAATDEELEIIDTRTGRAFELASSIRWRDELASRMGY